MNMARQSNKRAFYASIERLLSEDVKILAKEGDFAAVERAFTGHGHFLERHPDALPQKKETP